jgi:ABC-type Fe3+ transport system substrate-binding protein
MNKCLWKLTGVTLGAASLAMALGAQAFAAEDKAAVQALYQKAKSEGEVIVWGPTLAELEWIEPAMSKRFPGIKVKINADIRSAPKIIAEGRAGRTSLDVFVFSLGGMFAVQRRKLLGTADWAAFGTDKRAIYFGGQAGATHNIIYSVMYNHKLVKESELPKSWAGFTDAKWTGKLVASPFLLPRLSGFLAMEWGEEKTANWIRSLINNGKIMISNAPREGILRSGERPVSITDFASGSQRLAKRGAPFKYKMLDIVPAVQFVAAPMKGAPHQNASKLVAAWLTTPEASKAREAHNFAASVRPGANTMRAKEVGSLTGKVIVEHPKNMKIRRDFYNKLSPIVTGRKK